MKKLSGDQSGFTLTELIISVVILAAIGASLLALTNVLIKSAILAKQKAIALTAATNQIEYLKSLPYDSLAVQGGSISSSNPLPASKTVTVNGSIYTVVTSINFIDEAYDGCASYPSQALKEQYCRNYPPISGAPSVDQNPQDYKSVNVSTYSASGTKLAEVDTLISARVAETASTTGAMFVNVLDDNGNPVSGATVTITNSTLSPVVNVSDSTDSNGIAVFYGLKPDTTGYDYVVSAQKSNYSSLTTIAPSGTLQPNYPSQRIFTQLSSYVTLPIYPQGSDSLLIESTDINGVVLQNVKVYIKGGYKRYTINTNTSYYYDTISPSDTRPTTDSNGLVGINDLVPGEYIFCGDTGATSCTVGTTTYYLAAAVPYIGDNSLMPIIVPPYIPSSPPSTTFPYNSRNYVQKTRLLLTTASNHPRVRTLSPSEVSLGSSNISSFTFQLTGTNLPCSSIASSCGTTVQFVSGASTYTASCTGTTGSLLDCSVDLSGITLGIAQLRIAANGHTFTLPGSPLLGGINVVN